MTAPVAAPAAPATLVVPSAPPAAKVNAAIDRLIQRHGSAENALAVVATQLVGYEDREPEIARTMQDLRAKIPAEGSLVLTAEQAKQWQAFQVLKLTPEQVAEVTKERDTLKGTLGDRDRDALARQAATLAGFDPDALADHARAKGLHIELRDGTVKENGKDVPKKIPHVRPASDEKAALVPLTEYTGKLAAHEQRALKAVAATPDAPGTKWPAQTPTPDGGTPAGDPVAAFHQKTQGARDARPNPLIPRPVVKAS